jgi:hypothetical protein
MSEPIGIAVFVQGKAVAWFADWTEETRDWCTENYFGQWLTWRAKPPELIPLTAEESAANEQRAMDLLRVLNHE